jgi:hypothetical protein
MIIKVQQLLMLPLDADVFPHHIALVLILVAVRLLDI